MHHFKFSVLFFLSTCSWGAVFPGPPALIGASANNGNASANLPIGPMTPTSPLVTLFSFTTGSTYSTMRASSGSGMGAGHQVATGKTLTIWQLTCLNDSASTESIGLGYGTTDIGTSNASAPTQATFIGTGTSTIRILFEMPATIGNTGSIAPNMVVPASDYIFVYGQGANESYCWAYGYEQ